MSDRSGRRWIVGAAAIVIAIAVSAAALVVWRTIGSGDDTQQVVLQALDDAGPDPFTESVNITDVTQLASFGDSQRDAEPADQIANGADAGLYGGSRRAVCDRTKLSDALTSDPGRAQAWALAQGIAPGDIDRFLSSLTPAVLSYDTLVTNHGIRDGRAHAFQAVLQAGTTVFVDAYGVPRVRCACGNPLLSPTADVSAITVTGTRWASYQTTSVRYVQPAPAPQTTMPFVDIETREPLPTPVGGEGDGDSEGEGDGDAITVESLENGVVPEDVCEGVGNDLPDRRLVDGQASGIPNGYGAIFTDATAVGDLDGDGVADGAVVFGCSPGGAAIGSWSELVVYLAASNDPVHLETPSPVDEANEGGLGGAFSPSVDTLAIRDGRLTATWNVWGRDDPRGDPSRRVSTTWTVDADGATLVDSRRTR